MVEIGGKPILWHIMRICSTYGLNEFIIALGYRGEMIKQYFLNFYAINSDLTIDLSTGNTTIHEGNSPIWKVHLVDTGLHTQTGGRLKRLKSLLEKEEKFLFTYGDGVADLDLEALVNFHDAHGQIATVTTVRPPARFGRLTFEDDLVTEFHEKPQSGEGWINGGFFILSPKALDYIEGDASIWERDPVENLARHNQLAGFKHYGFWSCMDTLKEKNYLEDLWSSGNAPWKIWPK
jgi:glucose-1-phosphate cytidylyltransferase